ncbi:TIGR03088 family PEP-CTERM/XrtA system glycosyltransferase, partial [Rhodoferax sp.]|uniref:TIGR03088 family PEP-CTERM/XrtA system glycosyltransferase n=1 Tax=Rhodoferax sp. TaxID=50421 RepID=UPI0017BB8A40
MQVDSRPLVLHVMYRFDIGGLENGIVNLINHMPAGAYRHAVLALTEITDFKQRVQRQDVEFIALQKPPGQGFWQYGRLFKLFRQLRPAIVHSRNLAALEVQAPAWAAGVPVRLHGEHGRDMGDLEGNNRHYQRQRRFYKPFVHHYTALSRDLADYLMDKVQVSKPAITLACNGVDTAHFHAAPGGPDAIANCPFNPQQHWLVGTVGRMQAVKDQVMLAHAFVQALSLAPALQQRMRLVMVGDGPLRAQAQAVLAQAGVAHLAWLPGERSDVACILRGLHAFALPSLSEGISNSILEAMASALPVVATAVGGNADLVVQGKTGTCTAVKSIGTW